MVKKVEELRAKLNLLRLANLEVLLQDQVEVNQVGTTETSNLRVAKTVCGLLAESQWRRYERCLVDPAIQSLMSRIGTAVVLGLRRGIEREVFGIGNLIRAIAETACVAQVGGHDRVRRLAGLRGSDAGKLPSPQDCV